MLVKDHELAVRLLPDNEPILWGKTRLPEPDFLLPRGLLAVSHVAPPSLFGGGCVRLETFYLLQQIVYTLQVVTIKHLLAAPQLLNALDFDCAGLLYGPRRSLLLYRLPPFSSFLFLPGVVCCVWLIF